MPRGEEHYNYQGKGRSRIIPHALQGRVQSSLDDPDLLALRQDIALLDARLADLYAALSYAKGDVSYGKDGGTWARLGGLGRAAADALGLPNDCGAGTDCAEANSCDGRDDSAKRNVFDPPESGRGQPHHPEQSSRECHNYGTAAQGDPMGPIRALIEAVQAGLSDQYVWEQIREETEHRRKLVESERKRLVELSQMITAQQLVVMMGAIMDTIRRHVADRDTLLAISRDVQRLQSLPERTESESPG